MSRFMRPLAVLFLLVSGWTAVALGQANAALDQRMSQNEQTILRMYLEYQKLYYEDKSQLEELAAFEKLLDVYIRQVMEIYETLSLSEHAGAVARDVAARALVFKALMFLEKAPLNYRYFEQACYAYYEALNIYEGTDEPPVIYKDLPEPIQVGSRVYYRLLELLEDKGRGLQDFGKVSIFFRNFMVTANFNPENLELVKVSEQGDKTGAYTFSLAESRIKQAFEHVFQKSRDVQTYVALPAGAYILRLSGGVKSDFTPLTRFYVRANQQQNYVLEPLADWLVLYERPRDRRPDFARYQRNKSTFVAEGMTSVVGFDTAANGEEHSQATTGGKTAEAQVADIVRDILPGFNIKMTFDFSDAEIREKAVDIISRSIVEYVNSAAYYNSWGDWTACWQIAGSVRQVISPGSLIPTELLKLVHEVLAQL